MADRSTNVCTCGALRQAARHATRLYDEALAPTGLGLNQYAILARIERGGSKILQNLAESLVMDRSTLGHLLRPLEARGLLTIEAGVRDKRQRVITLTAAGNELMGRARPHWARAQEGFDRSFGADSAADLRDALQRVTATKPTGLAEASIETGAP